MVTWKLISPCKRRRLVFAEGQVYFECSEMPGLESITVPLEHPFEWMDRNFKGPSYPWADICSPDGIGELIEEFSCRRLSYDSYKLSAISGLLKAWSQTNRDCWSYWGLPLVSQKDINPKDTLDNQFGRALRWCVYGKWEPRPNIAFPSWSWLISSHSIFNFGSLWLPNTTTTLREKVHDLKVWIERKDGSLLKLSDFQLTGGFDLSEEDWTNHVHLGCWVARVGPFRKCDVGWESSKCWSFVPTSKDEDFDLGRTNVARANWSDYYLPI